MSHGLQLRPLALCLAGGQGQGSRGTQEVHVAHRRAAVPDQVEAVSCCFAHLAGCVLRSFASVRTVTCTPILLCRHTYRRLATTVDATRQALALTLPLHPHPRTCQSPATTLALCQALPTSPHHFPPVARTRSVVLDEAQSIKNPRTLAAHAAWTLHAHCRWCLSGTPIQNTVDDLYSYFRYGVQSVSASSGHCTRVRLVSRRGCRGPCAIAGCGLTWRDPGAAVILDAMRKILQEFSWQAGRQRNQADSPRQADVLNDAWAARLHPSPRAARKGLHPAAANAHACGILVTVH